jgi:hypothetical protein
MQKTHLYHSLQLADPPPTIVRFHPAQPVTLEVKIGDDWTLYPSSHGQGSTILDHDVLSSVCLPLLPLCQLVVDNLCQLYLWGENLHTGYLQVIEIVPL